MEVRGYKVCPEDINIFQFTILQFTLKNSIYFTALFPFIFIIMNSLILCIFKVDTKYNLYSREVSIRSIFRINVYDFDCVKLVQYLVYL